MKRTKIICTIGPASWDKDTLTKLAKAGMDIARLNMSHGTHEEKLKQIKFIRQISKELEKPLAVMVDLQGPKLRLGTIDGILEVKKGQEINLSISPIEGELPIQFDLSPYVKKGEKIFLNDGLVELKVDGVAGRVIKTVALNSGEVSSNKGVNVPDTKLKGASFTEKDYNDAEFALKMNADFLALSFVQTANNLKAVKELIKKHKSGTKVVVKIEKKEAVRNLQEIIKASDAVMVARGDLAIETDASEVPIIQQRIIKLSRQYHKPVIIATQMLESMIENPRPTRAETSDVASAVLDQVDAVMLSAESASGKYPVEAVQTMADIITSVEKQLDYKHYIRINWEEVDEKELTFTAIASAAAALSYKIGASTLVVATATGRIAGLVSAFRPSAKIVAATHDEQTRNQLVLNWGTESIIVKPTKDSDTFWKNIIEKVKKIDFVKKGDKVVLISGTTVGQTGATDTVKVVTV